MNNDLKGVDLREANLIGAYLESADLRGANLTGADLRFAVLKDADLKNANLKSADLEFAYLESADLKGTDLRGANLTGADLIETNLIGINLQGANLKDANLRDANLRDANLEDTNLEGANLEGANLYGTVFNTNDTICEYRTGKILTAPLIGYKVCSDKVIVTLEIPRGAIVFSINGAKCRTNKAKVIDIEGNDRAFSMYNGMSYYVGDVMTVYNFNCQYNVECSNGIHFFLNKDDAINYYY